MSDSIDQQISHLVEKDQSLEDFVDDLAELYKDNPVEVARILDERVDTSGRLLGLVRRASNTK